MRDSGRPEYEYRIEKEEKNRGCELTSVEESRDCK